MRVASLGFGAWAASVVAGFALLMTHQVGPGAAASAPAGWPADSSLERALDRPTLLVFFHPRCPCSDASLEELDRLLVRLEGPVATTILFVRLPGMEAGWELTSLFAAASRLPGVRIVVDEDGEEARRFGVETSGATLVYEAGGGLVFSGGLTASRGHAGGNEGSRAIESLLSNGVARTHGALVFGCPLEAPVAAESPPSCRD